MDAIIYMLPFLLAFLTATYSAYFAYKHRVWLFLAKMWWFRFFILLYRVHRISEALGWHSNEKFGRSESIAGCSMLHFKDRLFIFCTTIRHFGTYGAEKTDSCTIGYNGIMRSSPIPGYPSHVCAVGGGAPGGPYFWRKRYDVIIVHRTGSIFLLPSGCVLGHVIIVM